MDEKSIKDFDRNIEQMMNENSVAPPFGMWNRISSELGPVAAAGEEAVATSNPLIPRGVFAGFIAGGLVIGSLITGVLVYNGKANNEIAQNTNRTPIEVPALLAAPPVQDEIIAVVPTEQKEEVVVAPEKTISTRVAARPATKAEIKHETNRSIENKKVEATPETVAAIEDNAEEAISFPGIDMNDVEEQPAKEAKAVAQVDDKDEKEVKPIIKKTSSPNKKLRGFHPQKKRSFSYGTIIRAKKKK